MTSKALLRKRLGSAIGKNLTPAEFTAFFACFCSHDIRPELRTVKALTYEDVEAFSRYCGYNLNFPIPLPM